MRQQTSWLAKEQGRCCFAQNHSVQSKMDRWLLKNEKERLRELYWTNLIVAVPAASLVLQLWLRSDFLLTSPPRVMWSDNYFEGIV